MSRTVVFSTVLICCLTAPGAQPALAGESASCSSCAVQASIDRGDDAWARRAEGRDGIRAAPGPISEAVGAYEQAFEADPENFEALSKLLKALYFQGEYAVVDRDRKLEIFEHGRSLAEAAIDRLAAGHEGDPRPRLKTGGPPAELVAHLSSRPYSEGVYLWGAIHWGLWGRHRGKIAAARQGVAGTIRDYSKIAAALDPEYENGGGHRVLGRLHAEAPKLPLVTGWIDRDLAVSELEKAAALAPHDLLTRLYLIEALLEFDSSRRDEALASLRELVQIAPSPRTVIEETEVLADARELLSEIGG